MRLFSALLLIIMGFIVQACDGNGLIIPAYYDKPNEGLKWGLFVQAKKGGDLTLLREFPELDASNPDQYIKVFDFSRGCPKVS